MEKYIDDLAKQAEGTAPPGVVGSLMALEAIKHLTGAGQGLRNRMMIFDGLYGESRMIGTSRDPACPVCGQ